ncbi:MAG: hypothetical protein M3N28_04215 [Actinomycetota bacterium]|nr:hypothetical protein [Actinomycetota bacterium]
MGQVQVVREPFGPTTRPRQIAAAATLMLGAVPLAWMGATNAKPYYVIPVVGVVATLAWLVDGRRYLGPGIVALALGVALLASRDWGLEKYELALVVGAVGAGLLVVSLMNPAAVLGSAGFLLYAMLTALGLDSVLSSIAPGWIYAIVLLVWGGIRLAQTMQQGEGRSGTDPAHGEAEPSLA